MTFLNRRLFLAAGLALGTAFGGTAHAADNKVTIGFQTGVDPAKAAQAAGAYEKATGWQIAWRKFDSGADVIAAIASGDVQIGYVGSSPLAAAAINRVLDAARVTRAVHFCFGNYGGQTIQSGTWDALIAFLNALHADHLVLELAHRPKSDLDALRGLRPGIGIGVGVVDIKVNHVETPEEIAMALERAEQALGPDRVRYAHPDCGFWMLKRSVADRKIAALVKGRDLYLGRS